MKLNNETGSITILNNIFLTLKRLKVRNYVVYISFIFIFTIFSIFLSKSGFLNPNNLLNIGRQTALITILATALAFVLASGEIDLSLGTNVSMSTIIVAVTLQKLNFLQPWLAITIAIITTITIGALVGVINGFFVCKLRVPSFLTTLGMMGILSGVARWMSKLQSIPIMNKKFNYFFGGGSIGRIPVLFFWALLILVIAMIALNKTPYGRKVLATGGNLQAAFFSGIRVLNVKWSTLILSGTIGSFAGVLMAGRFAGGRYNLGDETLLIVIAATVLGGTSLFGGKASIVGAFVGAVMLGMISNGLILFGLEVPQQMIIRGAIIILAVAASMRGT